MTTLTLEKSTQILFQSAAVESIRASLDEILKQWAGVRSGRDSEAVHEMRVATRRLRASLSVFQLAFPPKLFEKFERKISYLTDALGEARDTDVYLEFVEREWKALDLDIEQESEKVGVGELVKHLKSQRKEQQEELVKTLRRLDPEELKKDGEALLASLRSRPRPTQTGGE